MGICRIQLVRPSDHSCHLQTFWYICSIGRFRMTPASSSESSSTLTSTSSSDGELSTDGDSSRLLFFHFPPLQFARSTSMRFFFASRSAFFCSLITRFHSFSSIGFFFFLPGPVSTSPSLHLISSSRPSVSSWIRIASSPDSPLGSIC